jgi:cold shock CspA family protein
MPTGKIIFFKRGSDDAPGFGFIHPDGAPPEREHNIYFPERRLQGEWEPRTGDRCEFVVEHVTNRDKGPKALSVTIIADEEITRTGGWD